MKKAERAHMDKVSRLGCIVCLNMGHETPQVELHHIREGTGLALRASNYEVIPLCEKHHRTGGKGVALHDGKRTWERLYGKQTDLLKQVLEMV